nr:MAG TPA: hypothetical protein [Caudoviricetes sp.]
MQVPQSRNSRIMANPAHLMALVSGVCHGIYNQAR